MTDATHVSENVGSVRTFSGRKGMQLCLSLLEFSAVFSC